MIKRQQICKTLFAAWLLLGSSALFAQVKVGTSPTTIETNSNLEVEAATTGRKVKVDKTSGQLTVKDGTEGTGKILTSDAVGGSSWQSPSTLRLQRTVFTGYFTGSVTLNTPLAGGTKVPFAITNPSADYDAAANDYVIPAAGMYRVEFNSQLGNIVPGKTYYNEWVSLLSSGSNLKVASFIVNGASGGWGPALFLTGVFAAGDRVGVQIASYDITGPQRVDAMTFTNGSIVVTKLD